jgi:CRP-like cAMP-binding protein
MQPDDALLRELHRHYLCAALSETQLQRLLASATGHEVAAGMAVFTRGETAQQFFMLRSGCVKLYRLSAQGDEKIMRLIYPSQTFAESILFMEVPLYPVSGAAVDAAELIALDRDTFLTILQESFATCQAVVAQMMRRIQIHWDEIETLALQNSRYRVVHYLLGLVSPDAQDAARVRLPTRKVVIAAHLAVTPETLSRTLRNLSDEGLIEVNGEELTLVDVRRLRQRMQ